MISENPDMIALALIAAVLLITFTYLITQGD